MGDSSGGTAAANSGQASSNSSMYSNVFLGLSAIAGAYAQSSASRAQGEYARSAYEADARLADLQAEYALKKGKEEADKHRRKVKQLQGTQRAAAAAAGIDISDTEGSAFQLISETGKFGAIDAITIENNAYREAWGMQYQAIESRGKGRFEQIAANGNANTSLITGGLQAAAYGSAAYKDYKANKGK